MQEQNIKGFEIHGFDTINVDVVNIISYAGSNSFHFAEKK